MKKIIYVISMAAAFMLGACSADDVLDQTPSKGDSAEGGYKITVVNEDGTPVDTAAVKIEFIDEDGTRLNYSASGTGNVVDGGSKTVTFTANSGYYLTGAASKKSGTCDFTASGTGYNQRTGACTNIKSDIKLTIGTAANKSVTVSAGTGGSATSGGTQQPGTTKSLTATPSSGYTFTGWTISGGGSLSSTTSSTTTYTFGTTAGTVTANFKADKVTYTLGIYVSDAATQRYKVRISPAAPVAVRVYYQYMTTSNPGTWIKSSADIQKGQTESGNFTIGAVTAYQAYGYGLGLESYAIHNGTSFEY